MTISAKWPARVAAAAESVAGIELLLLPVFYAHAGFGGTPLRPEQRRFGNTLDSYLKLYERCTQLAPSGFAPHSLRAATIGGIEPARSPRRRPPLPYPYRGADRRGRSLPRLLRPASR